MFGVEYRPVDFGSVIGLETPKELLQAVLKLQVFDPAYMFVGSYSSGKTTLGRIFARASLCSNPQPDQSPCNQCPSCLSFFKNTNPGYLEVDAANYGTKERITEIKESLQYESVAKRKIILLDEAHNISEEGKDALLAQLEEINNNIIFILCTTDFDKMPPALRSRCMQYHLPEPYEADVLQKLEKICVERKLEYDQEALRVIVQGIGRHYRDAENYLRQVSMLGPVTVDSVKKVVALYDSEIVEMFLKLPGDLSASVAIAEYLVAKMGIKRIYSSILRILNDSIKCMVDVPFESVVYKDLLKKMGSQYGQTLYSILDFVLSKNRFGDMVFFQSDILIMHYKFKKGGIEVKAFESPEGKEVSKREGSIADVINSKTLEPWERDRQLREYKAAKAAEKGDGKVVERVSKKWGPEMKGKVPEQLEKTKVSAEEFRRIISGGLNSNEEKI